VNTQLVNNVLINNDARGMQIVSAYDNDRFGNLSIDHNLYYNNGWNTETAWQPVDIQLFQGSKPTQYFYSISEIRAGTPWAHCLANNLTLEVYVASKRMLL
jgi:hypothetical protein